MAVYVFRNTGRLTNKTGARVGEIEEFITGDGGLPVAVSDRYERAFDALKGVGNPERKPRGFAVIRWRRHWTDLLPRRIRTRVLLRRAG